jgi:cytochrome c oxidase cbb3-type subunit 4
MDIDHQTYVAISKSYGLFLLIAMSIVAVAYAFWPSKQKTFKDAAQRILEDEDKPCQ